MLAAVSHAGRRSGSMLSETESFEELRSEGAARSRERRRRRLGIGQRLPTSLDHLRRNGNLLDTLGEHNSFPSPLSSPDVVFADAASMALLYRGDLGGSSSPRYGFLWGSLLLGGAGLAVKRASRGRKLPAPRSLVPPAAPRNTGETLKFANGTTGH